MESVYVIDVSAVVNAGARSKFFADRSNYGFPVGGIHYLMRYIVNRFVSMDAVVLCFDSPTKKTELIPDYKSGRDHNPSVYSQIQFAYENLLNCGIRCEKYDGYEADDLVYWTVSQWKNKAYETVIVSNDKDLCHNVQDNVRFQSICTGTQCISTGNFYDEVDSTPTPFNTISAKKCLLGCSSDKVPPMVFESGISPSEVYDRFIGFFNENNIGFTYNNTAYKRALYSFVNDSGLFSQKDKEELIKRVLVVYPADCPEGVTITPTVASDVDREAIAKFLTMINDYDSLRCFDLRKTTLSEDEKQMLRDRGRMISSGELAADNNLEVLGNPVAVKALTLDSFTKDF